MSKNILAFTNQQVKYTANMGMLYIRVKLTFAGLIGIPLTTFIVQKQSTLLKPWTLSLTV